MMVLEGRGSGKSFLYPWFTQEQSQTEEVSLSAYSGKHSVPILMSCYNYPQDTTQRQMVRQNKRIRSLNAT